MTEKRVQFNQIVKNQLPEYVQNEFPLLGDFLSQYYLGQEYKGGPLDLIQNIDQYIKLSECGDITKSTILNEVDDNADDTWLNQYQTTIAVENTEGFPDNWGLIKIDDEVITYASKTSISFVDCIRGFSGITSFTNASNPEDLVFTNSERAIHEKESVVENLSVLFLEEFLKKIKRQFLYGFQKDLDPKINEKQFIRQSKDFYSTRGTEESFKILFGALYGEQVSVVRPIDNVISPSNANFKKTRDVIVEPVLGNPEDLENLTLFQDEFENISKAYAPISAVEQVNVGVLTNRYYKLSLDASFNQNDGSTELIYGKFAVNAETRVIGQVGIAQTYMDVDSTLGFPNSGTLSFTYENGTAGVCTYADKTVNQFLGINTTGIDDIISDKTSIDQDTFAYAVGVGSTNPIRVKIRSVLHDLELPKTNYYQKKGSKVKIKSLGEIGNTVNANNWLFNTAQSYVVKSLVLVDSVNNTYKLITEDSNILRIGDKVTTHETIISGTQWGSLITSDFGPISKKYYTVTDVFDKSTCLITGTGIGDPNQVTKVTKTISKADSNLHDNLNKITANIQNIYTENDKVLVASSSLPYTGLTKLDPRLQKYTFSGTYAAGTEEIQITTGVDHNFYSGDAVYYTPQKSIIVTPLPDGTTVNQEVIESSLFGNQIDYRGEGLYFVKRINGNIVKFAKSTSDLYSGIFAQVSVSGGLNDVIITSNDIQKYSFDKKKIEPQKLFRQVYKPVHDGKKHETLPGYNGILIDGVEVLNYKSKDFVYYGNLNSIDVISGGKNYDVINPPVLSINDSVGTGATGTCSVNGSIEDIRIIDSGFDYLDVPTIKISGGNGKDATAVAKLNTVPHEVRFNATGVGLGTVAIGTVTDSNAGVNTSSIGFTTYHKFRDGERVVYDNSGGNVLVGLSTDAIYYASKQTEYTIKLHENFNDAVVGLNTISITNFGTGVQAFKSLKGKAVVSSIVVTNKGSGYENRQKSCPTTGINTASNTIEISSHGYETGEIINYSVDGTEIDGLSTSLDYYISVVNQDSFKLATVGVGTTVKDFYLRTNQFQDLRSTGVGTHTFNYPSISVEINGTVGISSILGNTFEATLQPIVRGEITGVDITRTGVGYGASEVLNFHRTPDVSVNSGRDAVLTPVISKGKIVDVSVAYGGTDYNSPPLLSVSGIGSDAKLVPQMNSAGTITSVNIQQSGIGYGTSDTFIKVVESGSGVNFRPSIQSWRVNEFKKNLSILNEDDAFISVPVNRDFGLQCSYVYAPRNLRKILYQTDGDGNVLYGKKDLSLVNGVEQSSGSHSPIIGWSYDGHPIYGPYGYVNKTGGPVVQMKSGYVEQATSKSNRPPTSVFPPEFFVEDFNWTSSTDESYLDENNGRFCVTPEFPKGTYAYFATYDGAPASAGVFKNYKQPVFPYLIGNSYHTKPNSFNFSRLSNQVDHDLNKTNWRRNSYPYGFAKDYSGYDYVMQSYDYVEQDSIIDYAEKGSLDSVGIVTGGISYKINDKLVFDDEITNTSNAVAKVTKLSGPGIAEISVTNQKFDNVEFYPTGSSFVGIATTNFGYVNNALVTVSGLTTTSSLIDGKYNIGIGTNRLVLTQGISTDGATGVVTYFPVAGNINFIRPNDILMVGYGNSEENVKVLSIDKQSSRLKVLRTHNIGVTAPIGLSHTSTTRIEDLPRSFVVDVGINTTFNSRRNTEYYFNPSEAVGLANSSTTVVGLGTTVPISNPGAGATQIFIPTQAIYLPSHKLQTGDEVTYHINQTNGTSIGIANDNQHGIGATSPTTTLLSVYEKLWATKLTDDFVGLSSVRVGLGSTGTYIGAASSVSTSGLLHFLGSGIGSYHSLKTNYSEVIKGSVDKNIVSVVGVATHGLTTKDKVFVEVSPGLTTSVAIKYNKANRKLVANPLGFSTSGIKTDTSTSGLQNTIQIDDHRLTTGQTVIHLSGDNPVSSLVDQQQYYVYVIDNNKFRLTDNLYETTRPLPKFVSLASSGAGTISPVNPPLTFYRNSKVEFDVSDSTLSYEQSSTSFAGFTLDFYRDSNFSQKYITNGLTDTFDVTNTGTIGVSGDAKVTLTVNKNTPDILYYKLTPVPTEENLTVNKEIVIDDNVDLNNQLLFTDSLYSGEFNIISTGTTTFTYDIEEYPEASSYTLGADSKLQYATISTSAYGRIEDITVLDGGSGYLSLPGITTINSAAGSGAVIEPFSKSIGKVSRVTIENIGFDYPSDKTLEPTAVLPQVLRIEPLTGFKYIGITSFGQGYNTDPSLVVLDGVTNEPVTDVDLRYNPDEQVVDVLENSESLNNTTPSIIPVGNSNGVRASNITYDNATQEVTVTLKKGFSGVVGQSGTYIDPFPFEVGSKFLVENVSVGIASTALGYNSSQYDYALFTVSEVSPNYGGLGIVTYSMANYLAKNVEYPGIMDSVNSVPSLVPEKWFPKFDVILQSSRFRPGDDIKSSGGAKGTVFSWDESSKYLTVESADDFVVDDVIEQVRFRGNKMPDNQYSSPTGAKGLIKEQISFESKYNFDYYSVVENGWEYNTGILNNELQRVHDNEYYHAFSYAIKSHVQYDEWKDVVGSLNHTAGFRKFSDLQVESKLPSAKSNTLRPGITTATDTTIEITSLQNLNSVNNYDLASENYLRLESSRYSDEINFKTRLITDYAESVSNRVVTIDDFSNLFNSNPRSTPFADVYRQRLADGRSQMFLAYIQDRLYTGERQVMFVNTLHDTGRGLTMINQYGAIDTVLDLGQFDYAIDGAESILRFYPHKYKLNNYNVVLWSYHIDTNQLGVTTSIAGTGSAGIGSTTIPGAPYNPTDGLNGSLVSIATTNVEIAGGAAKVIHTLGGIGTVTSGTRSAKLLVSVEGSDGSVEYDQVNLIHDGTNVGWQEYGQLTIHSQDAASSVGNIGTFWPYMSGNDLIVTYTPEAGLTTAYVNSIAIGIATEGYIGIGSYDMQHGEMSAQSTGISSSATPIAVGIASYGDAYDAGYCMVQIADKINGHYELAEVIFIDDYTDASNVMLTEYGNVHTSTGPAGLGTGAFPTAGLGTISARRTTDNQTELTFVPHAGIGVSITTFLNVLRVEENTELLPAAATREVGGEQVKDLGNASIESGYAEYEGTEVAIKRNFDLQHKTEPIFEKPYDGSSATIIDVSADTIRLSNHFFVTGQEVSYGHTDARTGISSAIGIASTSFPALGITTTYLPSSVFIIKKGEDKVQLARTAEDALKEIAVPLDLTHVGIGTSHTFIAKDQNTKVMVGIDNMIQAPIAGTSVTTTLAKHVPLGEDIIYFAGITSFFGADYIRVAAGSTSEIMKVLSVGIGSTNAIKVNRPWLGTNLGVHSAGTNVEKIRGNYNIIKNRIHFIEAPYGKTPLSTSTAAPDDRDWVGITTSSSFQGRVFTRSGVTGGTSETYSLNYLYDDITQQFNGYRDTFPLTVDKANVTGIATNNGIVLINGVFQGPGANYDYTMATVGSASSITFTGTAASVSYDVNTASIPVGGVIVSVGSTRGFGYQPLVAAGGTAVVSLAGTINSISIGNTGSGYRSGIQTVFVGIHTETFGPAGITSIGTATVSSGHVTGVTITNPQFFYKPRDIRNVGYTSITGLTTVTTATPHDLSVGNEVVMSGIAFTCDYAAAVGIQSAVYTHTTGIMTVTTSVGHGLSTSGKASNVILTGLAMTCGLGATINHIYPRNRDQVYDTSVGIKSDGTPYTVTNALYSPLTGLTTITIASHGFSNLDNVKFEPESLTFTCAKDGNATDHSYPRTTDVVYGQWLPITNVSTNTFQVNVLGVGTTGTASAAPSTNTSDHTFASATTDGLIHNDGTVTVNVTAARGPSDRYEHTFVSADSNAVVSGGNYAHTFDSATTNGVTVTGVGAFTPTAATYTPSTGNMVLTIAGHSYNTSQTVSFATGAITFTCAMDGGTTTHAYPRAGDPVAGIATAITAKTANTITVNVGASPLVNYTPTNASYNDQTGEMVLTIGTHGLQVDKSVRLADESITFTCSKDDNATNHAYPRSTDPYYQTAVGIASTSSTTITLNVGAAYARDQYIHRFVGAAGSALVTGGGYSHAYVRADDDAVTAAVSGTKFTPTDATYDPTTGNLVLSIAGVSTSGAGTTHGLLAPTTTTATAGTYDPVVGIMTLTVSGHGFLVGDFVKLADDSVTFSCTHGAGNKTYPRSSDPLSGTWVGIASTSTNTFAIQVLNTVPSTNTTAHTFVSATSGGIQKANQLVSIATSSIVFACEMDQYGSNHAYPRPSDPVAGINTVVTATTSSTITVQVGTSVTGFHDVSAATYYETTGDMKLSIGTHTLTDAASIKIQTDSLRFTCSKDSYATQHRYPRKGDPKYDGMVVAGVASATQFTVNVGTSTVATNYISGGYAQPAIIAPRGNNNSGSGQDIAFPGSTVIRVLSPTEFEVNTGISTRPHNYARGGRIDQRMKVIFDNPFSYENIPLSYSSDSPSTGGSGAKADVVVSQGSTVVDFKLTNLGYGYGVNHILTLPITGATGIPTTASYVDTTEYQVTVTQVDSDEFTSWSVGQIQVLDDFSSLFDGERKTFPITNGGEALSIQSKPGSLVTVQDCLFIFVNDILQIPGESYVFGGGSKISFTEAPKAEDSIKFLFYRGTGGADVVDRDIIETVKIGDELTLGYDRGLDQKSWLQEEDRTVVEIASANAVDTDSYDGQGVWEETTEYRPVVWTRQTEDKFVEGKIITKDRDLYKATLFPSAYLTQTVGIGTTIAYVDNARPFFNDKRENNVSTEFQKDIIIVNNAERVGAYATAIVLSQYIPTDNTGGSISTISITSGGKGYTSAPTVTIGTPVGVGTRAGLGATQSATATATISGGSVNSIAITSPSYGSTGYFHGSEPPILIGPPVALTETNTVVTFAGDQGLITGIGTTSLAGVAVTGLVFDMVIPSDSWLKESAVTQPAAATVCGLTTGDFFLVRNSNVGHGLTSLNTINGAVGVGTTYIDNVYRVAHYTTGVGTDAIGYGSTTLTQVVVSVNSLNGLTGLGYSMFFGEYSWGKLLLNNRSVSRAYTVNTSNGVTGIETGPILKRVKSLKVGSYSTDFNI